MAWPQGGRTLGRKLGRVGRNISALRDTCEVWKLSWAAAGHSLAKPDQNLLLDACNDNLVKPRDGGSGRSVRGNGHGNPFTMTSGHRSRAGIRIARKSVAVSDLQSLPRLFGSDIGRNYLHSSPIESKPSAAATSAAEATAPHIEHVETMHSTRSAVPGVSATDLLKIEDGRTLYSGMTSMELLAALGNLQLVSSEPIVDLSLKVLTSQLMRRPITSIPILWLVKRTAYSHFCAGEDAAEASVTLSRMWELGLKAILDYSLEDVEDEESCDRNCTGFLNMIRMTRSLPPGSVTSGCLKISALCPIGLMKRVSDHLRWQHKNPDYKLSWRRDTMPVFAPDSPTYHTQTTPEPFSSEEERDLLKAHQRLRQICDACAENNLPVLIDAEYSSIQPAIDYMAYAAAVEFNSSVGGTPIVYGTMQAYLKDTPDRLFLALSEASKRNVPLGIKLVRGAYMTRENAVAASLGVPSPIHGCIEDTHQCYNSCASVMLDRVASGNSAVIIATHNVDSGRLAAQRAADLGFDKADPRVQFSQLQGMSNSLSLALVHAGLNVSKYVPFGPVGQIVPYLVRRAEENRGVLGNSLADRRGLRKELGRRLGSAAGLKQFA